ncbi:MAG TPA: hypothetical protein VFN30_05410, partial [Chitinophagaceae bacterium]|nr:hypothetical protein [Chitinophagaceae bacterium]
LHALRDGLTGPPLVKDVVDASWVITESVVGQNDLTLTAEWTNGDEPLYFNRKFCGISYYAPAGWDLTVPMLSLATGTDPYQVSRTSVSEVGVFAVGNRAVSKPLRANAKIFLQGAYDAITHNMYATLWLFQLIPKNSPYSDSTNFKSTIKNYWKYFALLGPGSESIDSLLLYADPPSSPNPKVVDWVLAHLHRTSDQAVVATKAVFVKQDGQIVDTDGTGAFIDGINFEGVPEGNYYLSIRHRNHLGLRSQDILSLTSILPPAYNLTDTTKIFKGANYTVDLVAAQLEPNSNIYGAYAGNVVPNRDIVYNNTDNDNAELLNILQGNKAGRKSGYLNADVNMNGTARYNGSANDNAVMLSIVLKGNYAGRRRQPYLDVVIANPPF